MKIQFFCLPKIFSQKAVISGIQEPLNEFFPLGLYTVRGFQCSQCTVYLAPKSVQIFIHYMIIWIRFDTAMH